MDLETYKSGCGFCRDGETLESEFVELKMRGNRLEIDHDSGSFFSSFTESVQINFCIRCGRKLQSTEI